MLPCGGCGGRGEAVSGRIGGLATTEVPPSWSPCVEDGGDQLRPPAMLSPQSYRYKVTPQVPCLQFTSLYR